MTENPKKWSLQIRSHGSWTWKRSLETWTHEEYHNQYHEKQEHEKEHKLEHEENTMRGKSPMLPIPKVVNYKHLKQNKGIGSWLGPYELDYNQEHKGHK